MIALGKAKVGIGKTEEASEDSREKLKSKIPL